MIRGVLVAALVAAVAAAPASAAPRMTAADRAAIGTALDTFVKDAVLRRDLPAGWKLAGPGLRGGTTRQAWDAGTGVTAPYFPAEGNNFRNAWTGGLVAAGHAQLAIILHPKPGTNFDESGAAVDMRKIGGRWVVDLFYINAVIRSGKGKNGSCGTANCAISGPNDFGANGGGGGSTSSKISGHWLLIGLGGVGALVVLVPLGIWLRLRRRMRRIWADYHRART